MQDEDFNQDGPYRPLPHEVKAAKRLRVAERLARLGPRYYEALARPSAGVQSAEFRAKLKAAEEIAKVLIP